MTHLPGLASVEGSTLRLLRMALLSACAVSACWGCSGSPTAPEEFSDPNLVAQVKPQTDFALRLESNPSTGYSWRLARPLDPAFAMLLGSGYQAPTTKLVGAPGAETWRFHAVNAGQTTIALEYVHPWETGVPPARTAEFRIVIQ